MFDIGWQELFIVAVLAVIVVGPRDLPRVLKTVMHWVRKARGLAREFQSSIDEVAREVELDEIKQQATRVANADFDKEMEGILDPSGSMGDDMDMSAVEKSIKETAEQMNVDPKAKTESDAADDDAVNLIDDATDAAEAPPELEAHEFDVDDDNDYYEADDDGPAVGDAAEEAVADTVVDGGNGDTPPKEANG